MSASTSNEPDSKVLRTNNNVERARGRRGSSGRGRGGAKGAGNVLNVIVPVGKGRGRGNVITTSVAASSSLGIGIGRGNVITTSVAPRRLSGRGRGNVAAATNSVARVRVNVLNPAGNDRFMQATSTNLPVITYNKVAEYFQMLRVPEQRQCKDAKSSSPDYGENAIGYVKVNRSSLNCIVEAGVTPETNVNDTAYTTSVTVDEVTKDIQCAACNCQAQNTNCKHQTALIFWLLRRSEEPSPTDVACYWKKSILSTVKNIKSKTVDELSNRSTVLTEATDTLLKQFIELGRASNKNAGVIRYSQYGKKQTLYMDHLIISFMEKYGNEPTCAEFLSFCDAEMTDDVCKRIFYDTKDQSAKSEWYHIRFGRITASKIFETSRCKTYDGSLVGALMGSRGFKGNLATIRGQNLEVEIFDLLKNGKYPTIEKCGIIVRSDMPIFGSSPDGMTDDHVFEIKCPTKIKTVQCYIENGVLKEKVFFQMQLQMAMSGRSRGFLIVADPNFEINKKFTEYEVHFNKDMLDDVIKKCKIFWEKTIFPILK